jgi:hypothetical protein
VRFCAAVRSNGRLWGDRCSAGDKMNLNDPTTVALLVADSFSAAAHAYALYGGLLTAVYGEPRETRDADVAVADVSAHQAYAALARADVETLITFEHVRFGGLVLSRLTLVGVTPETGLNTVDLVRPRSDRYAHAALQRASDATLRGRTISVLALEDYVLFKVLSTRDRDLEDASAALRRSGAMADGGLLARELGLLAEELGDVDVRGRWAAVQGR